IGRPYGTGHTADARVRAARVSADPRACLRAASPQARDVVGQCSYFFVAQATRNVAHHGVRVIVALAAAKGLQLRRSVIAMLTRQARKLRRNSGTVRRMAA